MNTVDPAKRIMIALDVDETSQATNIIKVLEDYPVIYKVGNQLGTYEGWKNIIQLIHDTDSKIFCDTKFKDIPATVEKSCRAITRHQPDFFNVMADTNTRALSGAVLGRDSAVHDYSLPNKPILLGVTVLTSLSDGESKAIYGATSEEKVAQFASAAATAGLDGLVCSPHEVTSLRANKETESMILVTPGIRPEWAVTGDQSRVLSPKAAVDVGVDYMVIGRPITQPPKEVGSVKKALELIIEELR